MNYGGQLTLLRKTRTIIKDYFKSNGNSDHDTNNHNIVWKNQTILIWKIIQATQSTIRMVQSKQDKHEIPNWAAANVSSIKRLNNIMQTE